MNFSYWERESFLGKIDFTIVGSGIVGLSASVYLKEKFPRANIVVLEKGMLPTGASTRNAGFACFGSLSELLDDLDQMPEEAVIKLVTMRWQGLQNLRALLKDEQIGLRITGGTELFSKSQRELFDRCLDNLENFNKLLVPQIGPEVFAKTDISNYPFRDFEHAIFNPYEGQIDTGKMMKSLLAKAISLGITIFNGADLREYSENGSKVILNLSDRQLTTSQLIITTNAFARNLIEQVDVTPVRNQVLITKPIKDLNWEGIFHLDRGYFYFRNVRDRILIGGGRHLHAEEESTDQFGITSNIQMKLEEMLKSKILPKDQQLEVDMRWSGILGVGASREVIIKQISPRVSCGVRLGGMGIAIGSLIGKELVKLYT